MICNNCGIHLEDTAKFCTSCGKEYSAEISKQVPESSTSSEVSNCGFCGVSVSLNDQFCTACGNNLKEVTQEYVVDAQTHQPYIQYQAAEFTVQQKILALTATYIIKDVFGREFMRARKSMLSMFRPYIEVKNAFGQMLGYIQGNFWRTEWKFYDVSGILHGQVVFPFFMFFRKTFTLYTNFGVFHSGQSIFAKRFDCFDPNGQLTFVVDKQIFTIRDQFKIITNGILSPFITTMAAVCIDMKLFQGNKSRNLFQFL